MGLRNKNDLTQLLKDVKKQFIKLNKKLDTSKREKAENIFNLILTKLENQINSIESSEKQYKFLIQSIPEIIYSISPNGIFTFLNDAIHTLGYSPKDLIGKHYKIILHPDDYNKVSREKVLPKLKGKNTGLEKSPKLFDERRTFNRKTAGLEVRLLPKKEKSEKPMGVIHEIIASGEYIDGEVTSSGQYHKKHKKGKVIHTKFLGTIGIIRDVTKRKKIQEELIHAERLLAVGHLSSGVAHEFNNILTIIKGNIQLLLDSIKTKDQFYKSLKIIEEETERGAKIVQELNIFAKPTSSTTRPIDITTVINHAINIMKSQLQLRNISIKTTFHCHSMINADPGQLEQVFINLFMNARDAIHSKGKGTITVLAKDVDNKVEIYITDDGIGIDENNIYNIFTPFFTTKGARARDNFNIPGTGLGLFVTQSIISQHNGFINVESNKGKGTTFIIKLPTTDESVFEIKTKLQKRIKDTKLLKNKLVLIVDDEIAITNIIQNFISKLGAETRVANSGTEAMSLIKEYRFDLIILDIIIPDVDGIKIFKSIKHKYPDQPIIINTGQVEHLENKLLKFKNTYLIRKPFNISDFKSIISEII